MLGCIAAIMTGELESTIQRYELMTFIYQISKQISSGSWSKLLILHCWNNDRTLRSCYKYFPLKYSSIRPPWTCLGEGPRTAWWSSPWSDSSACRPLWLQHLPRPWQRSGRWDLSSTAVLSCSTELQYWAGVLSRAEQGPHMTCSGLETGARQDLSSQLRHWGWAGGAGWGGEFQDEHLEWE